MTHVSGTAAGGGRLLIKWPRAKVSLERLGPLSLKRFIKDHCGELIGSGLYRDVYVYEDDPRFVVKIERDLSQGAFANVAEWLNWCNNMDDQQLGPFLCPIAEIDCTGQILLMRRVRSGKPSEFPERLPSALTDLKYQNYGFIRRQFVCIDYSFLLPIRGRSRKVKFWDVTQ